MRKLEYKKGDSDKSLFFYYRPDDTYVPGLYIRKECTTQPRLYPEGTYLEFFCWSDCYKGELPVD